MVQAALEPAYFAEAFATGQQMALAEAFATILRPIQVLPQGLAGSMTDTPYCAAR